MATLLLQGLRAHGTDCAHSFEAAEDGGGQGLLDAEPWPKRLHRILAGDALAHLHSSGHWERLLQICRSFPGKNIITLHDASLLTGGCPFPLDCPHFATGCTEPCPRNFPDAPARRERLRELLLALNPLLVSPSAWLKNLARQSLGALPVRVVPNGVPWPEHEPDKLKVREKARLAFGVTQKALLVLFVAHGGTQAAYKSGDAWERIWKALKQQAPQAVCFMIGGRRSEQQGELMHWPYLTPANLQEVMLAADALVYPTRADNHPLVVLEAMAAKCPVVSYAEGGVGEQIEDGRTGRLVPPGDEAALVRAVLSVLGTRSGRLLAENAWTRGRERFSSARMLADYLQLYTKVIQTKEG